MPSSEEESERTEKLCLDFFFLWFPFILSLIVRKTAKERSLTSIILIFRAFSYRWAPPWSSKSPLILGASPNCQRFVILRALVIAKRPIQILTSSVRIWFELQSFTSKRSNLLQPMLSIIFSNRTFLELQIRTRIYLSRYCGSIPYS